LFCCDASVQNIPLSTKLSSFYRRAVRSAARRRWFAALGRRMAPLDRRLYKLTNGRLTILGPQGVAMPQTCLITTTGRRIGRERTTPVMYLRDGESLIVSSESFGQKRPAGWALNLAANPCTTVRLRDQVIACSARPLSEAEVERHWPNFVAAWPAHEAYLWRSEVRKMFSLEPKASPTRR
jgi:deazaflavin-dependent oxidoreductase (nitroreductase family)